MALRGGGAFTPGALLLVVGLLLAFAGGMSDSTKYVKYGIICLGGAGILFALAIYIRWQGWE